jgi:hypothetical protein
MNFKKVKCSECNKSIHKLSDLGYNDLKEEIYYCKKCLFKDNNLLLRIIIRVKLLKYDN